MLVTVLYRYTGSPAVSGSSTYSDVKAGAWYADAFTWAQQNSILPYWRMESSKIEPNAGVERGEFAVMLRNFFLYSGGDSFNDAISGLALIYADMPDYATDSHTGTINPALSWAYTYSILNGTSDHTMSPYEQITRAQWPRSLSAMTVSLSMPTAAASTIRTRSTRKRLRPLRTRSFGSSMSTAWRTD